MSDYFDLGTYQRKITTISPEAQLWFNRGLNWCYAYNHEEAIVCFEKAISADPDCAMAHWGVAYCIGPNYNKQWAAFDADDKRQSIERAQSEVKAALAVKVMSPAERALIEALSQRVPDAVVDDFTSWHDAYADAMRRVYGLHRDPDVATLFAEAVMNRTPWKLWDIATGTPAPGASTTEAIEVLETAMRQNAARGTKPHPGLLHIYIHLMEMSPHPERALKAGDALASLVPDAGHLIHMGTHIDVLCGDYLRVVERNSAAIVADRKFLVLRGPLNLYSLYRCHNYHFKAYGAMFLGQMAPALEAADEMIATLPAELLSISSPPMADWLEGFLPVKQHVFIRFGRWADILAQKLPDDPALYCVTTATIRYARAVALAATGEIAAAEEERQQFLAARDRVPQTRMVFNNTCLDILSIAEEMLIGELEYRKGNHETAFAHLRRSVALDDALPYDEPWGWMQPTRHALGALLLEQGRLDEAERVYRADLGLDGALARACQHPDNVWSLHGLHECLMRRGETAERGLIRQRLDLASARADVPVMSSCFCRLSQAA